MPTLPAAPVEAVKPPESIEALIQRVAHEEGISPTTLYNLADSESDLTPDAVGDHGCSLGIIQLNLCAHPEVSKDQALNPEWALTKAAKDIATNNDYIYTSCNCYGYIKANYLKDLPHMADIVPNTSVSHKGFVAVFYYKDSKGHSVKHIGYVLDEKGTIAEANKTRCLTDQRIVEKGDKYLAGYWDPNV